MRWVITGGLGFIGTALTKKLLQFEPSKVLIIDNQAAGVPGILAHKDIEVCEVTSAKDFSWTRKLNYINADIRSVELYNFALTGADYLVHLAANTGVQPSVEDPEYDLSVNVLGTLRLLESAAECSIRKFIFASSGAPLGTQKPPLNEDMAPRPSSPYGASKLAGEGYCSAFYQCFGLDTVALRFGNVYGPGSSHKTSIVAKLLNASKASQTFEIYGDGAQTRDYIYIDDLIAAIVLAAEVCDIGGEVFQIATERETSVNELVDLICELLRASGHELPEISYSATRSGDVKANYSNTSKAKGKIGWSAKTSLADGLKKTIEYFDSH